MLNGLKSLFVAMLALLVLVCVASAQAPVQDAGYRLAPEDVITITTLDVPEASGDYLIKKDGTIAVQYAGEIKVVGMTTGELQKFLIDKFKTQLKDPKVTINIKSSSIQRVYVLGSVKAAGVVDWKPKWRVTETIAAAGGLASAPERTTILMFRTGQQNRKISCKKVFIDGDDSENLDIQPGDVLQVTADVTTRVHVVGEVGKPGSVEILQGQGIAEGLAAAGGKSPASRLTGAKLMRHGQEVPIDLYGAVTKGNPAADIPMEENDTLYIPTMLTRIAVMGAVTEPGQIPVEDGRKVTLTEAIADAGGFGPGAVRNGVTVMSQNTDGKISSKKYDVKKLLAQKNPGEGAPVLQDGDVVYVALSGQTDNFSKAMQALSPLYFFGHFLGF